MSNSLLTEHDKISKLDTLHCPVLSTNTTGHYHHHHYLLILFLHLWKNTSRRPTLPQKPHMRMLYILCYKTHKARVHNDDNYNCSNNSSSSSSGSQVKSSIHCTKKSWPIAPPCPLKNHIFIKIKKNICMNERGHRAIMFFIPQTVLFSLPLPTLGYHPSPSHPQSAAALKMMVCKALE